MDRQAAFLKLFGQLDAQNSGSLELRELIQLVGRVYGSGPAYSSRLEEARSELLFLDSDGSSKVSMEEYLAVMHIFSDQASDEEVEFALLALQMERGVAFSRSSALKRCFRHLDDDGSGYIEMHELKSIVGQVAPQESASRAFGTLSMMDTDGDNRVSLEEFLDVFTVVTSEYSDEDFVAMYSRLMDRGLAVFYDADYTHPHEIRPYLEAQVLPALRQGLRALAKQLQEEQLQMALDKPWDEGQYQPRGWRALNPLRFLADYIKANMPSHGTAADSTASAGAEAASASATLVPDKPFADMACAEKMRVVFAQLDGHRSGSISSTDALDAAAVFGSGLGLPAADLSAEVLEGRMGMLATARVSVGDFAAALELLVSEASASDAEVSEALRRVIARRDVRYAQSMDEKLRYLFGMLDVDGSGALTLDELRALAHRLAPGASEDEVTATLTFLDEDGSNTVDAGEFVSAMAQLLEGLTPASLDDRINTMLHKETSVHPANEVEPRELAELVRAMHTHALAAQLSATVVMDKLASRPPLRQPLVLVDVRPRAETAVSGLPGALPLALRKLEDAAGGFEVAGDLTPIQEALAAANTPGGQPATMPAVVVCYCATGARGGAAAKAISAALGITAYNLCGGLINYYNQGGQVVDAKGRQIQAIHPGSQAYALYVERPNKYKLGSS